MKGREFKDTVFEMVASMARAYAAPKRLEILDVLAQGERDVESLAHHAGASVANTSRHLQLLKQARLVQSRRAGVRMIYRLTSPSVLECHLALRGLAEERLVELKEVAHSFFQSLDGLEPVSHEELVRRTDAGEVTVLDIRPREEFEAGHIEGAISVPLDQLDGALEWLPQDQEVVAYCRGPYCVLSAEAASRLRASGYQARRLDGGYPQWQMEGRPVEAPGS